MKVSVITVTYNSANTIEETIQSVLDQNYNDIEYLIIDGGSKDGTLDIVEKYRNRIYKVILEKDAGMYDAMNKGIRASTGGLISILNSDDLYYDKDVIKNVVENIGRYNAEVLWGDMVYVKRKNSFEVISVWKSSDYKRGFFKKGWHPPHPTFFVKKSVYETYGLFNTDFKISADYELMLRFLERYDVKSVYLPKFLVKMRAGGKTRKSVFNIANILVYKWEDYKAWRVNDLKANQFYVFFMKSLSKFF